MKKILVSDAPTVWNLLKGVMCIYKPAGLTASSVRKILIGNISRDLCDLECRPPVNHVFIEGDTSTSLSVHVAPSYADHPLVVGPRYQPNDFRCTWGAPLGKNVSGVFVKGVLGKATDTYFINGKVVEKSTFRHVSRTKLDAVLAAMQAAHQKQMYQQCGIDMQSQTAYDLAVQGLIKPENSKIPLLYSIKCIDFQPPDFTLEVQCINEHEMYLRTLIHDVGMQARSTATCTGLQCIRYDCFTLEHALLRKHWRLQFIIDNVKQNKELLTKTKVKERKESPTLKRVNIEDLTSESVNNKVIMPY
ncbi:putative tRNA pseudouridine synthase 2 [Blattella germanica]|nr:putative tRNA pseudouridine synthase 2 [Blattella germanica]